MNPRTIPKDAAEIVDRLLNEGSSIEFVIVPQTGFSRPALYRHRKNPKCSFRRNRAARIRKRSMKNVTAKMAARQREVWQRKIEERYVKKVPRVERILFSAIADKAIEHAKAYKRTSSAPGAVRGVPELRMTLRYAHAELDRLFKAVATLEQSDTKTDTGPVVVFRQAAGG